MKFSAIMIDIGRPYFKRALTCVEGIADEIIVMEGRPHDGMDVVDRFNLGVQKSTGDVIVVMFDDMVFSFKWREKAEEGLAHIGGSGIVNFVPNYFSAGVVTKDFIKSELGGYLWHPDYIHYCADLETAERARKALKYKEMLVDTCVYTEPHRPSTSAGSALYDEKMYRIRTDAGYPNKSLCDPKERESVLKSL